MRGKSLPEDMENTLDKDSLYLLKQFNIQGRKVIHLGDSYRHRSTNSLASCPSQGSFSRNSSISMSASGRSPSSSNDNCSSFEEERKLRCASRQLRRESTCEKPPEPDFILSHRVLLLGGGGVGKTTLIKRFQSPASFEEEELVCTGGDEQRVTVQLEEQESELMFCQGGSKVEGEEEEALIEDCHCILVVFSVTDLDSLKEAETLLQGLWQSGHLNTKAVIVVGNKIDLARAREVPIDEARRVASSHDCKYVEVSAGLNHNVDTLLVGTVKQIRLKMCCDARAAKAIFPKQGFLANRRRSAGLRVRGLLEKVISSEDKSRSCENLYVA